MFWLIEIAKSTARALLKMSTTMIFIFFFWLIRNFTSARGRERKKEGRKSLWYFNWFQPDHRKNPANILEVAALWSRRITNTKNAECNQQPEKKWLPLNWVLKMLIVPRSTRWWTYILLCSVHASQTNDVKTGNGLFVRSTYIDMGNQRSEWACMSLPVLRLPSSAL